MTKVSPIDNNITVNTNLGKRANAKTVENEVKNLVTQLVKTNPDITESQVLIEVNNYLDTLAKNGTKIGNARVSILPKLPEIINACRTPKIIEPPIKTTTDIIRVKDIPTESFIANSPLVNPDIKQTTAPISKKEIKRAERLDRQLGGGLSEITPNEASEREIWEQQMAEKPVSEPANSNTQNKKTANAEYMSAKKKKAVKKQTEEKSRLETQKRRINNSKPVRNARYCTSQGIMTTEARKAYERVQNSQGGFNWTNALDSYNNQSAKSAEESFKIFEEAGLLPEAKRNTKKSGKSTESNKEKSHRKSSGHSYSSTGYSSKTQTSSISTASKPTTNNVKKEVVTEIKEVVKEVPKTNKWLVAGSFVAGGALTWLGMNIFGNKHKNAS